MSEAFVLKDIFSDTKFCTVNNIISMNSINFGRIATQCTYYFYAYLQAIESEEQIGETINFYVPSGACGNFLKC